MPNYQAKIYEDSYRQNMSKKQLAEIQAKMQIESKVQQDEIKQRREVIGKIKKQINWLVGENIKQKKTLDVKRTTNQQQTRNLQKLEEMLSSKKEAHLDSQIVILYSEIFERLFNYYLADNKHQYRWQALNEGSRLSSPLKIFTDRGDSSPCSEPYSPYSPRSPTAPFKRSRSSQLFPDPLLSGMHSRRGSLKKNPHISSMKKLQTYDKEYIAKRLTQAYAHIKMHPDDLVQKLMLIYHQMQLRDITLQNRYVELVSEVQKKDDELVQSVDHLRFLQQKSYEIVDSEEGFGIQQLNEHEKEQYYESSLAALNQTLNTAAETNGDFKDKAGNFIFESYMFLTESIYRLCHVLESIRKVDDYGLSSELQKMGQKIQNSLEKLRVGFAYKSYSNGNGMKENTQFAEITLNDEDDSDKSMSSLDTISDRSFDSRVQPKRNTIVRGGKKHFTNKFTESVEPFLPQSGQALLNLFLSKFPNSMREGEIWSELIKRDRIIYHFTTNKRYVQYLEAHASRWDLVERDKAVQALENIHTLKREAMDIQHTRFAVLFNYVKELYKLVESARDDHIMQIKAKNPEYEIKTRHFEREEHFAHPDELKKRTLTDFKRKILGERVRKLQLQTGEEVKNNRRKADISLIQLLHDQISDLRSNPQQMLDDLANEQKFEDDFLSQTRQGLRTTMSNFQNQDKSFQADKVPFYLRDSNSHSASLLKKIVHLDMSFKSQLESAKIEHKIQQAKRKEKKDTEFDKKNPFQEGTPAQGSSQNRLEEKSTSKNTMTDLTRTRTLTFINPTPTESIRSSVPSRKPTVRLFNPLSNDHSLNSPIPGRESTFSREVQKLAVDTSSIIPNRVSKEFSKLAEGTRSTTNLRSTSRVRKFTFNANNTERDKSRLQTTINYTERTQPNSSMNHSATTAVGSSQRKMNTGASFFKLADQRATLLSRNGTESRKNIPLKRIVSPEIPDKVRVRETGNQSHFMRSRIKGEERIKDSTDNSFKSAFSNLETHLPSLGNLAEPLGSRTFVITSRKSPALESEGRNTPLSLLLNSSLSTLNDPYHRKGYLIKPPDDLSFGH